MTSPGERYNTSDTPSEDDVVATPATPGAEGLATDGDEGVGD
ncbi:hypothetical protein [Mycobacterium sp. 852013-51886_SCH5428379]|nr:hypothetical protein [Mycobacterium sp. 852013-51886_SCH5428379]